METTPIVIPGARQLIEAVNLLIEKYQPEYLLCFGSRSERKTFNSCFAEALDQNHVHYFLLMVTEDNARIEHEVQEYINNHYERATITILVHGIDSVKEGIPQGNHFFNLVCRHGMQLYSRSGLCLDIELPDVDPTKVLESAERHYFHRYNRAAGFLDAALDGIHKGYFANAVFMLHQAVEQACLGLLRVFLSYRTDIHNLSRLLNLTLCFSDEPSGVFPKKTVEEERLFQSLLKSYSDARYRDDYDVSGKDAEALCGLVKVFIGVTETLCTDQINRFRNDVVAMNQ